MYTGVVVSHGIIKSCYLCSKSVLGDVLSRFGSLHRVCEAHTELIVTSCDAVYCCCRWCEEECAVSCLCTYCDTSTGSNGTAKHLHTLVKKVVVCINSFLRISLIIAGIKNLYLISVESAACIDLICCNLRCVIYAITILCIVSCHRSDDTNLEGFLALCKYRYRCYCGYCHCCGCSNAEYFFQISHNKSPP